MDIKAMKGTIKDIVCFVSSVTLLIPMLAQNNYTTAVTPSEVPIRGIQGSSNSRRSNESDPDN